MRIVCPSCNATYDVPDQVVAARRTLRCSRCTTDFVARPADQPPLLPVPGPPAPELRVSDAERFTAPPASVTAQQPARLVLAAWALSIVAIVAAAGAGIIWRMPIMHAWPPATRVYAALGYLR